MQIMSTCNCPVHPEDAKCEVVLAYDEKKGEYVTIMRFDGHRLCFGRFFNVKWLGKDNAYKSAVEDYAERISAELARVTPIAVFK